MVPSNFRIEILAIRALLCALRSKGLTALIHLSDINIYNNNEQFHKKYSQKIEFSEQICNFFDVTQSWPVSIDTFYVSKPVS